MGKSKKEKVVAVESIKEEVTQDITPEMAQERAIEQLHNSIDAMGEEELITYLEQQPLVDVYFLVRDYIKLPQMKKIKNLRETNMDLYKRFQNINLEAKKSWEYDNSLAKIKDVNKAATNVYTLSLKIVKVLNDDIEAKLNKIMVAINKIEEVARIERTVWEDPQESIQEQSNESTEVEQTPTSEVNDDTSLENEQGIS